MNNEANATQNNSDIDPEVIREAISSYRKLIKNNGEERATLEPRISLIADFNLKYHESTVNENQLANSDNQLTTVCEEHEERNCENIETSSVSDVSDESTVTESMSTDYDDYEDDEMKDDKSRTGIKKKNLAMARYFDKKTEKLNVEISLLRLKLKQSKRRYYERN
ncbi:uncharacterized protein LOC124531220 [Vanessa cardui]|uniref:uncharacterized protein LOC124531220 n=1 Tax=Vanessa cardui TaxID=171605 RepID=UPI001F12BF05|nr:uncharacterized protein LOC124531220 [Vanessa cardui]